jgi:hypothetical protein
VNIFKIEIWVGGENFIFENDEESVAPTSVPYFFVVFFDSTVLISDGFTFVVPYPVLYLSKKR